MAKTLTLHTRVEPDIKAKADAVLGQLGISTTEAINMFLHQIVINNGIPFEVKIPNSETIAAIREIEDMRSGVTPKFSMSVDDFVREMGE